MALNPEGWVQNYGDYLYAVAMLKLSKKELAEDLVQETFMSALKAREQFRGDSSEKTWLVRILNNKIIDYYRKKDVMKELAGELESGDSSFYQHFFGPSLTSSHHWKKDAQPLNWQTDTSLESDEFAAVLQNCLEKLPSKMRPVFILKFMDELESDDICKEMGISASNYWVLIHRAKLVIRECLEKNWFDN